MIARTSCSRTSNEMSVSALTPPNASEMFCRSRMTSPILFLRMGGKPEWTLGTCGWSGSPGRRGRREYLGLGDPDVGRDRAGTAVLEANLGFDEAVVAAVVEGLDQRAVFLADEAASYLAGAGELAVVGIELLVQDQETMDLRGRHHRIGGEIGVDLFDAFPHELADLGPAGEIDVAGVRNIASLRVVAAGLVVDVEHHHDPVGAVAERHDFLHVREELELVLDVLRREHAAVSELADVLGPVDDLELS